MKVLIISDGFKDSLEAAQVAQAIKEGIYQANEHTQIFELLASDGGDGFLKVIRHYKPKLEVVKTATADPLGRSIEASYLYDNDTATAYIELAAASGIELLSKQERRVMETSTLGTGKLLDSAIAKGAKHIYVGLGGSATNDAGMGIAQALDWQFLDIDGKPLYPCGGSLNLVAQVIPPKDPKTKGIQIIAVNDVQNPLFGPQGAAYTYAKQKGASPLQIELLDSGLKHLNSLVSEVIGKDLGEVSGTGAAGGTAYGLKAFLNAAFEPGTPFMLKLSGFHEILDTYDIDLIITGEGSIDHQTKHGKLISGVVQVASSYNVPVYAICGRCFLDQNGIAELGLAAVEELYRPEQPEGYSFTHAESLVTQRATSIIAGL